MKPAIILLVVSTLGVAACLPTTFVRLERTECLGDCPVYTVTLYEDGTVLYEGRRFATPLGKRWGRISPKDVKRLMDAVHGVPPWECDPHRFVTCMPEAIITVSVDGQPRRIIDYYGDPCVPHLLRALESEIDAAGGFPHLVLFVQGSFK